MSSAPRNDRSREALALGALLAPATSALVLTTTSPTIVLSFAAQAIAIVCSYAKRFVSMPQAVLGVAFSFGVPMGLAVSLGGNEWSFAAVAAAVPAQAWWLMLGNLFWVLAHDSQYAMVDRDDDLCIGTKTSAITLGRVDAAAVMVFYAPYPLSWALLGRWA